MFPDPTSRRVECQISNNKDSYSDNRFSDIFDVTNLVRGPFRGPTPFSYSVYNYNSPRQFCSRIRRPLVFDIYGRIVVKTKSVLEYVNN